MLKVVAFVRYPFKLFTLRFSNQCRPHSVRDLKLLSEPIVSIRCMMWKIWRSPTLRRYWKSIIDFKWQKQGSLCSFSLGLSQDRVCTDSFENFSVKSLKQDQSNDTKFKPPLFLIVHTFKKRHHSATCSLYLKIMLRLVTQGLQDSPLCGSTKLSSIGPRPQLDGGGGSRLNL